MPDKAVFVDRDNTLIEDPGYISDPAAVKLLPGVELALKSLHGAGYKVIICSNQSGVARGMFSEQTLGEIHRELERQLDAKGARIDAIYYCPYHPQGSVDEYVKESHLRKPAPGMLLDASRAHDIDLQQSWMVGDSTRDIQAGQRAGCRTVLLRRPEAAAEEPSEAEEGGARADFVVRNLVDAARVIIREQGKPLREEPAEPLAESDQAADAASTSAAPPRSAPKRGVPAAPIPTVPRSTDRLEDLSERELLQELLRAERRREEEAERRAAEYERFSVAKLVAGGAQGLSIALLIWVLIRYAMGDATGAMVWGLVALVVQFMALAFYLMRTR